MQYSEKNEVMVDESVEWIDSLLDVISDWKFYQPKGAICKEILRVNKLIGNEYFDRRFEHIESSGEETKKRSDKFEEKVKNFEEGLNTEIREFESDENDHDQARPSLTEKLLNFARNLLGGQRTDDALERFEKKVTEDIYDHFAMLSLDAHSSRPEGFSLKRELTQRMAADFGLNLYLTDKISPGLKDDAKAVLTDLAEDFEKWFIDEKKGYVETTFGKIISVETFRDFVKNDENRDEEENFLVLNADVRETTVAPRAGVATV